jgi:crossover junction endodeoxyribonuclease RuvC
MRILGVDPGLQRTGWGIIDVKGNSLKYIDCGVAASNSADTLAERLKQLADGLSSIIGKFSPDTAAVEETFSNVNAASTLKLGQARGAILLVLSQAGLSVHEYAATLVKKSIVGVGRAEKTQVKAMVGVLLPGFKNAPADASDALAIAICHAHHRRP